MKDESVNKRINNILENKKYQECLLKIKEYEANRIFCKHDIEHFLDVARIAYIICLENNIQVRKDIIYAISLLHDIGRWMQYELKISHEEASCQLSIGILEEAGYEAYEIEIITEAIKSHRNKENDKDSLNSIIYKSDKISRNCFSCGAEPECNWSNEKKNIRIKY